MIDKKTKIGVAEDWKIAFPQLGLYQQNKLYKVVGPLVIGLELIKLPRTEEYRPHFVLYSLFEEDVKDSLSIPVLLKEYYDAKGLQYNIPYVKSNVFNDVVESVRKQTPLSFEGDISFKTIIAIIDDYSKKLPLSAAPNSYLQAVLQEAKFKTSLFIGVTEAQSILEDILNKTWDITHFNACKVDINEWVQKLKNTMANRNQILAQVEISKHDKKIKGLPGSKLIP